LAFLPEAFDVELDGFPDEPQSFVTRLSGGDTAGKIGDVGSERRGTLFDHDEARHRGLSDLFRPACFSTLFSVPGGMSMPGFPATVAMPGLVGCRN
jgi:hypothetical protein